MIRIGFGGILKHTSTNRESLGIVIADCAKPPPPIRSSCFSEGSGVALFRFHLDLGF